MSPDAIKLAVAKSPSALITVREIEGGHGQILGARQILKAMQIPEAQFLIINAHPHRKMKGKKPRLGNFFFWPP